MSKYDILSNCYELFLSYFINIKYNILYLLLNILDVKNDIQKLKYLTLK